MNKHQPLPFSLFLDDTTSILNIHLRSNSSHLLVSASQRVDQSEGPLGSGAEDGPPALWFVVKSARLSWQPQSSHRPHRSASPSRTWVKGYGKSISDPPSLGHLKEWLCTLGLRWCDWLVRFLCRTYCNQDLLNGLIAGVTTSRPSFAVYNVTILFLKTHVATPVMQRSSPDRGLPGFDFALDDWPDMSFECVVRFGRGD